MCFTEPKKIPEANEAVLGFIIKMHTKGISYHMPSRGTENKEIAKSLVIKERQ